MIGLGYILSIGIFIADLIFFSYGGWLLAALSVIFTFFLQGWIRKKRWNVYRCEGQSEGESKLRASALRVQNKAKQKYRYSLGAEVWIIPGGDTHAALLDWKTIGITQGALRMNPRVLEALIAHEYGHIMNGDSFFISIAAIHFFGLFFFLLLARFALIAVVYLVLLLLFVVGVLRFNLLSLFVSHRLTGGIRRGCEKMLRGILRVGGSVARLFGKYGDEQADRYAVELGYGLYLKRYLEQYSAAVPDRGAVSPLRNRVTDVSKRIIKIEAHMRNSRGI